jgi:polysaccharide pyruvyl transferase WcaK-like protein
MFLNPEKALHPHEIINMLSQVDLLISTRFHSAIFSLIAKTPVIAISYQQKGIGIMKDLNLEHFCRDISALNTIDVLNLCEEILSHSDQIREKIHSEVSKAREKIESISKNLQPIAKPDMTL